MTGLDILLRRFGSLSLAAMIVGLGLSGATHAQDEVVTKVVPKSEAAIKQSFAPVVKRAAPTVVNVYVRHKIQQSVSPLFNDPVFRRFFGQQFGVPRERIQNSLGSGVMVDSTGVVVTNYHVIRGDAQSEIKVALSDGREFDATLILKDEQTDLAVLQLDAEGADFPAIQFANSDGLEVGDLVLAIGDPFGVGQTVTSGIVSALARTKVGISDYQFFIQTDAAINPGNSGGALVDMDGHLVGINTAIFSKSGGSHGIGFAIPVNLIRRVVPELIQHGRVIRGDIGITHVTETEEGLRVARLDPDGPAKAAGLRGPKVTRERRGPFIVESVDRSYADIIIAIDGKRTETAADFLEHIESRKPGDVVELTILREEQTVTIRITLAGDQPAPRARPQRETPV